MRQYLAGDVILDALGERDILVIGQVGIGHPLAVDIQHRFAFWIALAR